MDDEVVRIFQNVGILEALKESIVPFEAMQFINAAGQILLETKLPTNYKPYGLAPSNWFFQPTLEAKLRDCFQHKKQIKWFEGYEVNDANTEHKSAHLKATNIATQKEIEVTSKYIVGCGGGRSMIRKLMKVQFENLDFDQSWMVVDTFVKSDEDLELLPALHQQICVPSRPTTYVPGVGRHRRFEFMLRADETAESISKPEKITALIQPFIDPEKLEIARSAVYIFHGLTVNQWKKGRFILAGDSAHQMPPFAGQGMCSGIRDAHNLAFKLDLVLNKKASEEILDTYQSERKPHVITLSKGAIKIGGFVQTQSKLKAMWRNFQFFLAENSKFIHDKLRDETIKKLPYKTGFLGKHHSFSGHLNIQPVVQLVENKSLLLDELLGNRFALITTKIVQPEQVEDFKNELSGKVFLVGKDFSSSEYQNWMKVNKMEFVIIRPDRYIFDGGRMASLEEVLIGLFKLLK